MGGVGKQRYKQRQSAVAHVIIVHIHDPVLSSLKMKGIRLLLFIVVYIRLYISRPSLWCSQSSCMGNES
jgi:hypothetical protein